MFLKLDILVVLARQNNFPNSLLVITECSVKTLNFLLRHNPELTSEGVSFKKESRQRKAVTSEEKRREEKRREEKRKEKKRKEKKRKEKKRKN